MLSAGTSFFCVFPGNSLPTMVLKAIRTYWLGCMEGKKATIGQMLIWTQLSRMAPSILFAMVITVAITATSATAKVRETTGSLITSLVLMLGVRSLVLAYLTYILVIRGTASPFAALSARASQKNRGKLDKSAYV